MGKRGPQKTPTAILAARGSWLAKTRPDQRPVDAGIPDPPQWLAGDGLEEWNYVISLLSASGVLTRRDKTALAIYCQSYADWLAAGRELAEHGANQLAEGGTLLPHPAVARRNKAWEQIVRLGAQFGLSPSTRPNVNQASKEADKKSARFIRVS